MVELLAPAGNFISLRAVLENGADAVYFGLDDYNMRANAKNFSLDDLKEVSIIEEGVLCNCYDEKITDMDKFNEQMEIIDELNSCILKSKMGDVQEQLFAGDIYNEYNKLIKIYLDKDWYN